jgi:hypothetical protein
VTAIVSKKRPKLFFGGVILFYFICHGWHTLALSLVRAEKDFVPELGIRKPPAPVHKERHALFLGSQHDMSARTLLDRRSSLRSNICQELLPTLHILDRVHPVIPYREFPPGFDSDLSTASQQRQLGHVAPGDRTDTERNHQSSTNQSYRDQDSSAKRCQWYIDRFDSLSPWKRKRRWWWLRCRKHWIVGIVCEGVLSNVAPKDQLQSCGGICEPECLLESLWWRVKSDISTEKESEETPANISECCIYLL